MVSLDETDLPQDVDSLQHMLNETQREMSSIMVEMNNKHESKEYHELFGRHTKLAEQRRKINDRIEQLKEIEVA